MRAIFNILAGVALVACVSARGAEAPPALLALLEDEAAFSAALQEAYSAETEQLATASSKLAVLVGSDIEAAREGFAAAQARMDGLRATFEAGTARYPENAALQNAYGEMLYDQYDESEEALRRWERAKELDPKLGLAYNNLGIHYMHAGAYALGLENLDAALKIDDKHPDFLFNMVQAYMNHAPFMEELRGWEPKRVYKEAMKLSKRAAENAPEDYQLLSDYAVNFWKAEQMGAKPDWKDAAEAWETARPHAEGEDTLFLTWLMEARAWIKDEKPKRAIECLDEALKLHPENELVLRLLGELTGQEAA